MIIFSLRRSLKNQQPRFRSTTPIDLLKPLRQWLNDLEICDLDRARLICQLVPAQCPFAQEISLAGLIHFKIPPLCKLNPLYEEVIGLRFRALCYLAEKCPSEVCRYC